MIESALLSSGLRNIAGVDEAGRGACAGPLVVAAVVLRDVNSEAMRSVADSKSLSPRARESLVAPILENSISHSIITISADEIDRIGLHRANLEGMRRAVSALECELDYVLTDGYEIEGITTPHLAVWKGDQVALSISAASIIAKVHRDQLMVELDREFPGYGLAQHKGYVTRSHQEALERIGVSRIHRKSYANIAALVHN